MNIKTLQLIYEKLLVLREDNEPSPKSEMSPEELKRETQLAALNKDNPGIEMDF